jgi:hypothetical protein
MPGVLSGGDVYQSEFMVKYYKNTMICVVKDEAVVAIVGQPHCIVNDQS